MTEAKLNQELTNFVEKCNRMLDSKFVLVDKHIGDLLAEIAKSKYIYNLVAEYVVAYNFEQEYKKATRVKEHFALPKEEARIIPFVFLLLSKLDDKQIDITLLLKTHFVSNDPYKLFLEKIIKEFRDSVVFMLSDESEYNIKDSPKNKVKLTKELASRIEYLLKEWHGGVEEDNKLKSHTKQTISQMIDSLIIVLRRQEEDIASSLFVGLRSYVFGVSKKHFKQLKEVNEVISIVRKV